MQEISFSGIDGSEAERFIQSVRKAAFLQDRFDDPKWMAQFASIWLEGSALRWHASLDKDVRGDWNRLEAAILQRYPAEPLREQHSLSDLHNAQGNLVATVPSRLSVTIPTFVQPTASSPTLPFSATFIQARIKVVCDSVPHVTGYVSRTLHDKWGTQMVTQDISDALIVTWDTQSPNLQLIRMLNNAQGQDWLALRFTAKNPDFVGDRVLWATFGAARGTRDEYTTFWTPASPGLDGLPLWSCSSNNVLTPHTLGEPLDVGLTLNPADGKRPHIFFCQSYKRFWASQPEHAAARLMLEPVDALTLH